MTPKQLGPIMRMLPFLARLKISCSSLSPGSPNSLKPAEMMMAAFTPALTHSSIRSGTVFAGVTMTARSTLSGTLPILGRLFFKNLIPFRVYGIDLAFKRTGKQVKHDGAAYRAQIIFGADDSDGTREENGIQRLRIAYNKVLGGVCVAFPWRSPWY